MTDAIEGTTDEDTEGDDGKWRPAVLVMALLYKVCYKSLLQIHILLGTHLFNINSK